MRSELVDPIFSPMGGNVVNINAYSSAQDDLAYVHSAIPTPTPTGTPPAENRTVIELLTPSIVNNASNQILKFKVSYIGPSGNPVDFPFDELLFDIAAISPSGANPLGYTISVSNAVEYAGSIDPVWGTDLFGNQGSNYYHFETNQKIDIAAGVASFVFAVDLSHTVHHPYGSSGTPPAQEPIDVYVRFGHDSLYAQTPVTFINH